MIDITTRDKSDCFAIGKESNCKATGRRIGGGTCKDCCFYKPAGYEKYVRIEEDGAVHLYTINERREVLYGKKNS